LFFDRFTVIINYFIVVDLNFFGDKHGEFCTVSDFLSFFSMWFLLKMFRLKELKPIQTIAFVLKDNYSEDLGIDVSQVETLAIKNLESFFNYKTVGKKFDLVSTVLSSQDSKFYPVETFSKLFTEFNFFFGIINFCVNKTLSYLQKKTQKMLPMILRLKLIIFSLKHLVHLKKKT